MSIYIACHKAHPFLTTDPVYKPIHVGKALSYKDLGFQGDDTGDNISDKNRYYSELTGLYWIWKNTNSQFVGLSHYRRFFFSQKPTLAMQIKKCYGYLGLQGKKRFGVYYSSNIHSKNLILTGAETQKLLNTYDAIIPIRRKLRYSVYEQYKRKHIIADFDKTKQIISKKYPDYQDAFNTCMKQKEILHCNMFLLKRQLFDEYMNWLFTILFELENQTDISTYSNYQKRLYGFISERLFDVWLIKNKPKTKKLPVVYFKNLKI